MGLVRDMKLVAALRKLKSDESKVKGNMGKMITPLLAFLGTVASLYSDQIQHYVTLHPQIAVAAAGVGALAATFAPQPHK